MILKKVALSPPSPSLLFLVVSTLISSFGLSASAQNLDDDLALVDRFLEVRDKVNLMKELDVHLRILRQRYSPSIVAIQDMKLAYARNNRSKARSIAAEMPENDQLFEEMVFTLFEYAAQEKDSSGKQQAARMYFETKLKDTVPAADTEKYDFLVEMLKLHAKTARKDKEKLAALRAWADKNNMEIPPESPIQDLIDRNDAAEKIIFKESVADPNAKVNAQELEELIRQQIEAEWGKQDYWFYKGVIERARAQVLLGLHDKALSTLDSFKTKFEKVNEQVFKAIDADQKIATADKEGVKKSSSIFAGVRYVKGLVYLLKARKLYDAAAVLESNGQTTKAQELVSTAKGHLIGKKSSGPTTAVYNFYLCVLKHDGSQEAFKSILRYEYCRDLAQKWHDKSMKALDKKPLEIGKAYYSLGQYDKAREYFAKYKDDEPSAEGYEAIFYAIPSAVQADKLELVDEYLDTLQKKYLEYNVKPKDYFTQSCLYLSGVYRTKMNESKDPEKKKEYELIRNEYYQRSLTGGASAAVVYYLANAASKAAIDFKKAKKRTASAKKYQEAISTFKKLIEDFPGSVEAIKSYKRMAELHDYFGDVRDSVAMYEEYLQVVPDPDITGRLDKAETMFIIANSHFKAEQYDKALNFTETLEQYIQNNNFDTDSQEIIEKVKYFAENGSLLRIYALNKRSIPKKKELRLLRKELKGSPGSADLIAKVEETKKVVDDALNDTIKEFEAWLDKYSASEQAPLVMAALGGFYQELEDVAKAQAVYDKLKSLYPSHEVVRQISLNIVRVYLDQDDFERAAKALADINIKDLDNNSLKFLLKAFLIEEKPLDMDEPTVKVCSEAALAAATELRLRYEKQNKSDSNKLHWVDYRKARALYNLGRLSQAKTILQEVAVASPLGTYIFDINFLLGAIAAAENDYKAVGTTYAELMSLSRRMDQDFNRDLRVRVEWASAYQDAKDKQLIKKARGHAMMAKHTNIDVLEDDTVIYLHKAWYLFILYSKSLGENINELKKDFFQKFPTSPYAASVRKL